ncbi:MAG: phospholipase A [Spirochaetes bacterium]|nr:phospholipase A [Spirochaetota bacterium]
MKRILAVAALLSIFSLAVQAEDDESDFTSPGFTSYKPVYFIFGLGSEYSDDLVKVNFSMKYDPLPDLKTGLYLAFTQTMFWDFFGESGPFKEINFNPELFLRFESGYNFLDDVRIPGFDFIQAGWEHRSNGQDGVTSKGWDRAYGQLQLGVGTAFFVKAGAKYFRYLDVPEFEGRFLSLRDNPDIEEYTSNFEFQLMVGFEDMPVFFIPQKLVISAGPGGGRNALDFSKGWQQADIFFGRLVGNMRLYAQVWNGYGQSVLDYNKQSLSGHVGIAIDF